MVRAVPLGQIGVTELLETDLLIIGTWVEGFVLAGVGPARATRDWLAALPRLPGLLAATFCTFGVAPKGTLPAMRKALEDRGITVMAEAAFGPRARGITADTARFTSQLLAPRMARPRGWMNGWSGSSPSSRARRRGWSSSACTTTAPQRLPLRHLR